MLLGLYPYAVGFTDPLHDAQSYTDPFGSYVRRIAKSNVTNARKKLGENRPPDRLISTLETQQLLTNHVPTADDFGNRMLTS